MSQEILLVSLLIFSLRVLNNALGTIRVIAITNGHRVLAFFLAFIESLIFAFTASQVLNDLTNVPYLLAYSSGFAIGGYIGMIIEERFVTGYISVNVISAVKGHDIAIELREQGYGVTETVGEGAMGAVSMLRCVTHRKDVMLVLDIVRRINPDAFVTTEEARAVHRGWMRSRSTLTR